MTALQWANSSRFKSTSVNKAATLFTLLVVRQHVVIASVEHVAAETNGECDDLSRRDKNGNFRDPLQVVPGVRDLEADRDWRVRETLRLCDPRSDLPFHEFWTAVGRIVEFARGKVADPTVLGSTQRSLGSSSSSSNRAQFRRPRSAGTLYEGTASPITHLLSHYPYLLRINAERLLRWIRPVDAMIDKAQVATCASEAELLRRQ